MAKLEKADWLKAGMGVLRDQDHSRLRIQHLCEILKVTKGSFYHHFEGMDGYIEDLMQYWVELQTTAFIRQSSQEKSTTGKIRKLDELVMQADQAVEAAIRAWSYTQPSVRYYLLKVDEKRLKYLTQLLYDQLGDRKVAAARAKLELATLVGIQTLFPNISKKQMQQLYSQYMNRK